MVVEEGRVLFQVLRVDTGQGLLVEVGLVTAALDAGLVVDADDVGVLVGGVGEAGERQESGKRINFRDALTSEQCDQVI